MQFVVLLLSDSNELSKTEAATAKKKIIYHNKTPSERAPEATKFEKLKH